MEVSIERARPEHAAAAARVTYDVFKKVHDAHGLPSDFPDLAGLEKLFARRIVQEGLYAVVALMGSEVVGVNFLNLRDPVGGFGPIAVAESHQGRGIAKALMADILNEARRRGVDQVRCVQDAFNMTSLSLYTRLGMEHKETVVVMTAAPAAHPDERVRPMTRGDVDAADELSRRLYKTSRRNAVIDAIEHSTPFVFERDGRVTAYFLPGIGGHALAESAEELVVLVRETARRVPTKAQTRFICPLRVEGLYRRFLENGCKPVKCMNLLALGRYEAPEPFWLPSVLY